MSEFCENDENAEVNQNTLLAVLLTVAKSYAEQGENDARRKGLLEELDFIISQMQAGEEYDKDMLDYLIDELGINLDDLGLDDDESSTFIEELRNELSLNDGSDESQTSEPNEDDELQELELEIELLEARINDGSSRDYKHLHELYEIRNNHVSYQARLEEELSAWRVSIRHYCINCLKTMRSFIPVNIFDSSVEQLQEIGIPIEIAKRITSKQCLWITRMPTEEIVRLHEADLSTRFNIAGQTLDIVEVAAIYACMPDRFVNDRDGKKYACKESVEQTFRSMLAEWDAGNLPSNRLRAAVYEGYSDTDGPITDVESVRDYQVVVGTIPVAKPRRSFEDICSKHSILRGKNKRVSA
jgi:hypothetical protein